MGEGFVVMQSNDVDIYYYQDEPGELLHAHRLGIHMGFHWRTAPYAEQGNYD